MKGYLLDTSICVFLLRGKRSVEERLNEIDEDECYITDAVVAELLFGAYYSDRVEENLRQVEKFVAEMKVIPFHETVHTFAKERTALWKAGKKIDDFDLLIGCTSVAEGMVMVTQNAKDFKNIKGIQIENWIP